MKPLTASVSLRTPRWLAGFFAAGVVLTAAACGLLGDSGFIVYSFGEEGARNIAVVRPGDDGPRVIVARPGDDFGPVWSPDRGRIAFLSDRDGNVELYVTVAEVEAPDGTPAMRVTNTGVDESQPTWSPDGTRLAYTSPDDDGSPRVFWLELSDLLPHRLLFGSDSEVDPAWSPAGRWIAFASLDKDGNSTGLFLRNPDGVNRLQLSESRDRLPAWSPDGKKLAFVSTRDGNEEIYVLIVGDEGPIGQARRITDNEACDFAPAWSPDGKHIAFLRKPVRESGSLPLDCMGDGEIFGDGDIFIVSDKGENEGALTENDFEEVALGWGPDGRLVFESQPSGTSHLFVMDASGAEQQLLPTGEQPSSDADW